jgi:hypothetical protein
MNYIYKALPFKGNVSELDPSLVAAQLTILINSQNFEGWEFYQINAVNISVSPGCIAGLIGTKAFDQKYDMAIFRKTLSQEDLAQQAINREKQQNAINNDTSKPKYETHIKCPECKALVRKEANLCRHCNVKLIPQY